MSDVGVTGPDDIAINPGFDGESDQQVTELVGLDSQQSHEYSVEVVVGANESLTAESATCRTGATDQGLTNTARLSSGQSASACASLDIANMSVSDSLPDTGGPGLGWLIAGLVLGSMGLASARWLRVEYVRANT